MLIHNLKSAGKKNAPGIPGHFFYFPERIFVNPC